MYCDECKKNIATIHLVSVVNGKKTERHLCEACAHQEDGFSLNPQFSINDLISGFFNFNQPHTQVSEKICPQCGMSFSRFKQDGKLGCANCYDTFRSELMPMLKSIHGSVQHNGRTIDINQNKKSSQLDLLKEQLNQAVAGENYEQAAKLRDQIKQLEAGEEK